jgi:lysophospholipase L1-like esterase
MVLAAGSVLVAALGVEGLVRVRQYLRYGAAGTNTYATTIDPATRLTIPTPGQTTPRIHIDSRGFRNPELEVPKPAGRIRVAFLGASTTFCAEVSNNETTWPHLVTEKLRQQWPGKSFDYVNAGVPGWGVSHSQRNLETRVKPLAPDVIVIYHAINDLSKDTRELAERQGIVRGSVDQPSWLGRYSVTWFLIEKNLQVISRQRQAGDGAGRHLTFEPRSLSAGFEQRLTSLVRSAKAIAPVVAMATFSQKLRRNQPPAEQLRAANTHLYYMPYMTVDGLLTALDEYNRVIKETARAHGAVLIEDEESIPGDDIHFNDSVHFKDAGSRLMAERITKVLIPSQIVRNFPK